MGRRRDWATLMSDAETLKKTVTSTVENEEMLRQQWLKQEAEKPGRVDDAVEEGDVNEEEKENEMTMKKERKETESNGMTMMKMKKRKKNNASGTQEEDTKEVQELSTRSKKLQSSEEEQREDVIMMTQTQAVDATGKKEGFIDAERDMPEIEEDDDHDDDHEEEMGKQKQQKQKNPENVNTAANAAMPQAGPATLTIVPVVDNATIQKERIAKLMPDGTAISPNPSRLEAETASGTSMRQVFLPPIPASPAHVTPAATAEKVKDARAADGGQGVSHMERQPQKDKEKGKEKVTEEEVQEQQETAARTRSQAQAEKLKDTVTEKDNAHAAGAKERATPEKERKEKTMPETTDNVVTEHIITNAAGIDEDAQHMKRPTTRFIGLSSKQGDALHDIISQYWVSFAVEKPSSSL